MLIPKGNMGFRGIVMFKVLWKTVSGILNRRLVSVIVYHDTFNGFRKGQVTGTASFKANILHHMLSMREEFLYGVFIYIHKAYSALD